MQLDELREDRLAVLITQNPALTTVFVSPGPAELVARRILQSREPTVGYGMGPLYAMLGVEIDNALADGEWRVA